MYSNILVPVALDHKHETSQAIEIAEKLLSEGGKITLMTVVEPVAGYVASYLPKGQLERNLHEIEDGLKQEIGDYKNIKVAVVKGHPGSTIVDYAREKNSDLIVIASHKPGLQDFFLGSTAARVVRYSRCAVHVMR
ncbi:MAG: universal stress protein [Rhodobacterales bacterium]|nr:MAG: universal stress protein [Rhodobacterales bacterium]